MHQRSFFICHKSVDNKKQTVISHAFYNTNIAEAKSIKYRNLANDKPIFSFLKHLSIVSVIRNLFVQYEFFDYFVSWGFTLLTSVNHNRQRKINITCDLYWSLVVGEIKRIVVLFGFIFYELCCHLDFNVVVFFISAKKKDLIFILVFLFRQKFNFCIFNTSYDAFQMQVT